MNGVMVVRFRILPGSHEFLQGGVCVYVCGGGHLVGSLNLEVSTLGKV